VGSPEPGWAEFHAATQPRNEPEESPNTATEQNLSPSEKMPGKTIDGPLRNAVPPPNFTAGNGPAQPAPRQAEPSARPAEPSARPAEPSARSAGRAAAHRAPAQPRIELTPVRRLILTGLLMALLLTAAGLSGAYLAPRAPASRPAAAATSSPDGGAPGTGRPVPTESVVPTETSGPSASAPAGPVGRPADGLAGWAAPLSSRLNIPLVAMQAYGYAEYVLTQQKPACRLSWTTLAGIGKVESNHGQAGGVLRPDGRSQPPIIGPALDGKEGRKQQADTDAGRLDQDSTWDHAVGPMQFIPSTWQQFAIDADRDGQADPYDIDDAALAAAQLLCSNQRDLSTAAGWWAAVQAYNDVQTYALDVFAAANDYGTRSL
jgi:Transglycosylase SLT domain